VGAGFSRPKNIGLAFAASNDMPHYPHHLPSFDYKGFHRYFLTFCTHSRAEHFTTAQNVDLVQSQILRTGASLGAELTAYCFMPDHLHLLVEGTSPDTDVKAFVSRAKQLAGYHFKQETGHRLCQRYGYERVLREDETTLEVIRYIVENPVRAGLTRDVASYPFWGSEVYSREQLMECIQDVRAWAG
jgi:putative transposase